MKSYKIYKKDDKVIIEYPKFLYETVLYCRTKNYCSQINTKLFESDEELPVVEYIKLNNNLELRTYLEGAPIDYIKQNDFILSKQEKKERTKKV